MNKWLSSYQSDSAGNRTWPRYKLVIYICEKFEENWSKDVEVKVWTNNLSGNFCK